MSGWKQVALALQPYVLEQRYANLVNVIKRRDRSIRLVLEDLYDPHNAAACLRSAEAFGVQQIEMIRTQTKQKEANLAGGRSVHKGAAKWLTVRTHSRPEDCLLTLKDEGFHVVATDLQPGSIPIESLLDRMTADDSEERLEDVAVVFGNESTGITPTVRAMADTLMHIPMQGFVQSLNISVACGVTLSLMRSRRPAKPLAPEVQDTLLGYWMYRDVPHSKHILKQCQVGIPDRRPDEFQL